MSIRNAVAKGTVAMTDSVLEALQQDVAELKREVQELRATVPLARILENMRDSIAGLRQDLDNRFAGVHTRFDRSDEAVQTTMDSITTAVVAGFERVESRMQDNHDRLEREINALSTLINPLN